MIELHLIRHADAGDPLAWTRPDAERPLSPKGEKQADRLGRCLAGVDFRPDAIVTSPKVRAAGTAERVAAILGAGVTVDGRLAGGFDLATVEALLHDKRTTFVVVTTLEDAPLREGEQFCDELVKRAFHLGGLVLNKTLPGAVFGLFLLWQRDLGSPLSAPPALAGDRLVIGFFLLGAHFARRKQFQPHDRFLLFFQSLSPPANTPLRDRRPSRGMHGAPDEILNSAMP